MTGTLLSLLGLALIDSLNPSALAVTVFLLLQGGSYAPRVMTYVFAVFLTYLGIGALLMLGLGSLWGYVEGPTAYAVQGVAGALLLGYALFAPGEPRGRKARTPPSRGLPAIFFLGVTVTVVEFSTAFPYLGAIALLTNADLTAAGWLPILVAYNVIFVLPPLLLLAAYAAYGARVRVRLERLRERFEGGGSRETLLWMVGLVGFFLLADSLAFFDFFGLAQVPGTP